MYLDDVIIFKIGLVRSGHDVAASLFNLPLDGDAQIAVHGRRRFVAGHDAVLAVPRPVLALALSITIPHLLAARAGPQPNIQRRVRAGAHV